MCPIHTRTHHATSHTWVAIARIYAARAMRPEISVSKKWINLGEKTTRVPAPTCRLPATEWLTQCTECALNELCRLSPTCRHTERRRLSAQLGEHKTASVSWVRSLEAVDWPMIRLRWVGVALSFCLPVCLLSLYRVYASQNTDSQYSTLVA